MAAQITHILAGEEALGRASPAAAAGILEEGGAYFRLGCQGPDIFYHNQRTKPSGLHYGSLAHRRGYGLILEGMLGLPRPDPIYAGSPAGAYLLGLATHAAVDRATHPFIVYFSGWPDPADPESFRFASCHPFLERVLDGALLRALRGIEPSSYDVGALLAPPLAASAEEARVSAEEIVALWAAGLRAAFPRAAGSDILLERRIGNALSDAAFFYAVTSPMAAAGRATEDWFARLDERAGIRSVSLLYPESLPEGLDPMNLAHAAWPHPSGDGRGSSSSYLDLVEAGIEAAANALRLTLAAMGGDRAAVRALAESIGTGGLSVTDLSGSSMAPRVAKPLALDGLMAQEYRRRAARAREGQARRSAEGREAASLPPANPASGSPAN
jgi:hypothetical protein